MNSSQFKGSLLAASEWTQYSIYEEAHKEDLCLSRGRPQSWDPGTHLAKTKHCILQECQQETIRGLLHLKHVVLISGFGDSFMIVLREYVILLGASVLTPLKVVFNAAISAIQCGIRGGKHKSFESPHKGHHSYSTTTLNGKLHILWWNIEVSTIMSRLEHSQYPFKYLIIPHEFNKTVSLAIVQ